MVLALAGCAWFFLGIRQAHDTDVANAIINGDSRLTAQDATRASSLLKSADTLNPDIQVVLLRSQLAIRQGDFQRAITLARQATAKEPKNVETWLALAVAGYDAKSPFLGAVAKIAQLDPQYIRSKR